MSLAGVCIAVLDGLRFLPNGCVADLTAPFGKNGGGNEPVVGEADGDVGVGGRVGGIAETRELATDMIGLRGAGEFVRKMKDER